MTASNLPDGQREVVSGVAEAVKPSGLTSRWCSHWLVRDVLAPLFFSRAALIIVAWLGLHFLHAHLYGTKWEVADDGFGHTVTERLSANAHPFINMWSRWDAGWYLAIAQHGYSLSLDNNPT